MYLHLSAPSVLCHVRAAQGRVEIIRACGVERAPSVWWGGSHERWDNVAPLQSAHSLVLPPFVGARGHS